MPATESGARFTALARAAIVHHLGQGPAPVAAGDDELAARGACFVTLKLGGELRGCIGSLKRTRALGDDVIANAVAAASRDSRFAALRVDELAAVCVEVSVLSEPEFLEFSDEADLLRQLRPHEDGLILFAGCRSATFLPQVWQQLPTPAQFLAALKTKAGIRPQAGHAGLLAARYAVCSYSEAEHTPAAPAALGAHSASP